MDVQEESHSDHRQISAGIVQQITHQGDVQQTGNNASAVEESTTSPDLKTVQKLEGPLSRYSMKVMIKQETMR